MRLFRDKAAPNESHSRKPLYHTLRPIWVCDPSTLMLE